MWTQAVVDLSTECESDASLSRINVLSKELMLSLPDPVLAASRSCMNALLLCLKDAARLRCWCNEEKKYPLLYFREYLIPGDNPVKINDQM